MFLKHFFEFKDYTLEKLNGVARTYEFKIQKVENIERN